eukprot:UN25529
MPEPDANGRRPFYCIICQQQMTSQETWQLHITSKEHKQQLEYAIPSKWEPPKKASEIEIQCNKCNKPIITQKDYEDFIRSHWERHVRTDEHRRNSHSGPPPPVAGSRKRPAPFPSRPGPPKRSLAPPPPNNMMRS